MKKKIFITGGSGLLGVNWALAIRDRFSVTLGLHERKVSIAGVDNESCDLTSVASVMHHLKRIKPDVVIHAAGLTSVEVCEKSPSDARNLNTALAGRVASACAEADIRLVHVSTDHLFAGNKPMSEESDPVQPLNVYGMTKAESETVVSRAYPPALIIRTNFYGWGLPYRRSFSDYILETLRRGEQVSLFHDVYYTPIFTETLVHVVHELLEKSATGILHVVGDERISKYEFGCSLAARFNLDSKLIIPTSIKDRKDLVTRPLDMSLSNGKVCNLLGRSLGVVDSHLTKMLEQESVGIKNELMLIK